MDNLPSFLDQVETELQRYISETWSMETFAELLEAMSDNLNDIVSLFTRKGDECYALLEKGTFTSERQRVGCFLVTFHWVEQAKAFLILWRDVLFEQQKADILLSDGRITHKDRFDLVNRSEKSLQKAAASVKSVLLQRVQAMGKDDKLLAKYVFQLQLQHNPWPVYKKQFDELAAQVPTILDGHHRLQKTAQFFKKIARLIDEVIEEYRQDLSVLEETANKATAFIEENVEERLGRINQQLESIEAGVHIDDHMSAFGHHLEIPIHQLESKIQAPVNVVSGMVQYREINFRRNGGQWLDSEILPLLNDVKKLVEQLGDGLRMSLLNIRNRVTLLTGEQVEGRNGDNRQEDISQPLLVFRKRLRSERKRMEEMIKLIHQRLDDQFQISDIYELEQDFLPIPLQSTINQFRINRNQLFVRVRDWMYGQVGRVRDLLSLVETEESLSISEKIVRYIQYRTNDPENEQYSDIFRTKGYIGESFWVGRQQELERTEKLIEHWKLGFRGAIVLSGQRFSGKSLFGELIANRYFEEEAIRLMPNETIDLKGRRLEAGCDLEEALAFVMKYSVRSKPLVWIDDLDLWSHKDHPLGLNVRRLCNYIDDYSGKVFFMVSMSNWLRAHLDRIYSIDKVFQAEVNLDQMKREDIHRAILIRHGATHKTLVSSNGEEIGPQEFGKIVRRIYNIAKGNIGESLMYWSHMTRKLDEDRVIYEAKKERHLPEFIHADNAILLTALMMEKQTNEYELRKLFGPSFKSKYGGVLQRLISLGLMTRNIDGSLEINELVVNELGRQLDQKRYLKFNV
ncbi:MAG: hypothetical protein AAF990_08720 [Bacteroidota bacterium]